MEIVAFSIEKKTSKKGKDYLVLLGVCKDGSKYVLGYVYPNK